MQTKKNPNPIIAVHNSIDWLTVTITTSETRNRIAERCFQLREDYLALGEQSRDWTSYGYQGYDCGDLRWGRRGQDDLITLRGHGANQHFREFGYAATHCSRIDLAVTIRHAFHDINVASEAYNTLQEVARDLPISRNYSIITSLLGGDTLYVGKRSSQQFGRLYDKTLESASEEWANCWRWEVEFKKPLAWEVLTSLLRSSQPDEWINAQVHQWFEDRYVQPSWVVNNSYPAIAIKRKKTADEKALEWLAKTVRPTVERLIRRGKATQMLNSLGILTEVQED